MTEIAVLYVTLGLLIASLAMDIDLNLDPFSWNRMSVAEFLLMPIVSTLIWPVVLVWIFINTKQYFKEIGDD